MSGYLIKWEAKSCFVRKRLSIEILCKDPYGSEDTFTSTMKSVEAGSRLVSSIELPAFQYLKGCSKIRQRLDFA
ncbi:DgyrCDS11797 [Dimorphilus gyrociliatus]|uniref:DgyrCDS11797 n=1 Tax=Dimorphilus gyrociliatus TaxID=2664684 RepID=A0A7I8W5G1_9ANNE|nr:DgyrCDS11797 [Dimorphilus gyrociliatus]